MLPRHVVMLTWMMLFASVASAVEIHDAARAGDLARVRALVTADPTEATLPDERDCQPIHFAADGDQPEVLAYLQAQGAELTAIDIDGDTPLHWAAIANRPNSAAWLLDHGAAINARNHHLNTPLMYATIRRHHEMVSFLVARGADLEIPDDYGRTPLLWTVREGGNLEMVQHLLKLGADVNAHDRFDDTSLSLAAWRGFKTLVGILLDHGAEVEIGGDMGASLLREAAGCGIPRLYNELVAAGMEIAPDREGQRGLLRLAAGGGSAEIVRDLIARGAALNAVDDYGWTALHYAAARRRPEVITALLKHPVDVNLRTRSGYSALNLAEEKGGIEAAELLRHHNVETGARQFPDLRGPYFGQPRPGSEPQLFTPDIVATPYGQHGNVTFSPDGMEAYWSGHTDMPDSGYTYGSILCSRMEGGRWTAPRMAPFAAERQGDDVPFFSPDGQQLFFLSRRPIDPDATGLGKKNVWVVERQSEDWSDPAPLSPVINRHNLHWQFAVARNGNLYFHTRLGSAETQGTYCSRFVNGEYTEAEFLGFKGRCPFIAPDESYLITLEILPEGRTLFIRYRTEDGQWGSPINLTAKLRRGITGVCPTVSPDGKYLFFINGSNGNNNAYWVAADFIETLRHDQVSG